jgi:hypothetical protein
MTLAVRGRGAGRTCVDPPVQGDGTGSSYTTRRWLAYGRITDAGAATLDLSGVGLPRIHLRHDGYFLFRVPRAVSGRHGDVEIRGADNSTIRRLCVYVGHSGRGGGLGAPGGCAGLAPAKADPILADARRLVALKLVRAHGGFHAGQTVAIWRAPNRTRGTCTFLALANVRPNRRVATECRGPAIPTGIETAKYFGLISGLTPPNVVRVELNGSEAVFDSGAFLAEPARSGPYRVVAYDRHGRAVASEALR